MSYLDTPISQDPTGGVAGSVRAPKGVLRLAQASVIVSSLALVIGLWLSSSRGGSGSIQAISLIVVAWAMCWVGLFVRSASISVDDAGVLWGWRIIQIRLSRRRILHITKYNDALAFKPKRGSTWFVTAKDWQPMMSMWREIQKRDYPVTEEKCNAPWRARVQGYGGVLNFVVSAAALFSVAQLLML